MMAACRHRRKSRNSEKIIGLALGTILAASLGGKAAAAHGSGHLLSIARPKTGAPSGGTLDCSQLEALWESAGGTPAAAFMAAEIATAESGGHQYATRNDGNGTADEGYWQINTSHGALATYDPYGNARAAVIISGDGTDWDPWTTYQTGAYAGKC